MSKHYGIATGLADFPTTNEQEKDQLLLPLHRAIISLAEQVSDAVGLTDVPITDIQQQKLNVQYLANRIAKLSFVANVAIPYGALISLDTTASESKLYKADATPGSNKIAHGVCVEANGIAINQRGRVILFSALVTGLSGVAPGVIYWTGATGQFVGSMPVAPGALQQKVGIGLNSTTIMLNISL